MDILEIFKFTTSSFISFCAIVVWPLVVVLLALVFKKHIISFLSYFSKYIYELKAKLPGGVEIEINKQKEIDRNPSEIINQDSNDFKAALKALTTVEIERNDFKLKANVAELKLHFEFIHNFIFDSQFNLLKLIWQSNTKSINIQFVNNYFLKTKLGQSPFDWDFSTYLEFLKATKVLEITDNKVFLTRLGEEYINYISREKIPLPNNNL